MLIKKADDKSKRISLLESLQDSPRLDARQKSWARDELMRLRRGIQGERDAAHYLDNYLADTRNYALLHDLRFELAGETAQIDHLLISRTYSFYLLETKNFSGNLKINEQGEFSVRYQGEREFGIPSPLEQSRRHERLMKKALETLGMTGRVGTGPTFHHVVLVDPKATINRPPSKALDTSMVIKADQFRTWHEQHVEQDNSLSNAVAGLLNVRSSETVEEWGRLLARLHRPADQLQLPDFMAPKESPALGPAHQVASRPTVAEAIGSSVAPQADEGLRRKLICATCRQKISFAEGKFCWNNEARFGGLQYCRKHQSEVRSLTV